MSKILKKITKKYKWLRFLNYKTTKLAVLSAALFGLCLSSGASFAKYRDENYGNGNAGVARLEYGQVTYNPSPLKQPDENTDIEGGYHCFIASFKLNIYKSEIKVGYKLQLRIVEPSFKINEFSYGESGITKTSFLPKKATDGFYVFSDDGETQLEKNISSITGDNKLVYNPNSWYYAVGNNENGSITYNWASSNNITGDIIDIDIGTVEAGKELEKDFKILFFVNATKIVNGAVKTWEAENSKIIYNLDMVQEK